MIRPAQIAEMDVFRELVDTLPVMKQAIRLYRSLGFREISGCSDNPPEAICFELAL